MSGEMNRNDFMSQLESLLQNVSPTEREEALQYYNDYFDDAGAENEKEVIEALGNPARVAENIKRDLMENSEARAKASDRALVEYGQPAGSSQGQTGQSQAKASKEPGTKSGMPTWAIVILLILASPVLLGLAGGLIGLVVSLLAGWFSIIVGSGAAALGLIAAMIILFVVGCMCMVLDPLVGLAVIGGGLLCGSIGILFLMLTVAMGGIVTPAAIRGIAELFKKKKSE